MRGQETTLSHLAEVTQDFPQTTMANRMSQILLALGNTYRTILVTKQTIPVPHCQAL